jgi:hypothetical protein
VLRGTLMLLAIPFFFLAGVAVTMLVYPLRERPRAALAWSLGVECLLLICFLAACLASMPFRGPDAAIQSTKKLSTPPRVMASSRARKAFNLGVP